MNDLKELFGDSFCIPLPSIPVDESELVPIGGSRKKKRLLFGSKIASQNPLLVQRSIEYFIKKCPIGYFLIGFWGHGINSYAFYYSRVDSWSKIFFRLGYGGAYMDNEVEAERIREFLPRYFEFENKISSKVKKFIAVDSMMSGFYKIVLSNGKRCQIKQSLLLNPDFDDRFGHLFAF
ncbi:MAG: hypothetical protein AB2L22_13065 [Syntrophales bacterium]